MITSQNGTGVTPASKATETSKASEAGPEASSLEDEHVKRLLDNHKKTATQHDNQKTSVEAIQKQTESERKKEIASIDGKISRRQAETDKEVAASKKAEQALEEKRKAADSEAIRQCRPAKGAFDADNPSAEDVVAVSAKTLEEIADENGIPWVKADTTMTMSASVANWLTAGTSCFVGTSAAITSGLTDAEGLMRHPEIVLAASAAGAVFAVPAKMAVTTCWYLAGQQAASADSGRPSGTKATMIAVAVSVFLWAIDVAVENSGLLALRSTQILPGSPGFGMLLVPMLVSSAFILVCALSGYLRGRRDVFLNRLGRLQSDDYERRRAERESDPLVIVAKAAVDVCVQLRFEIAKLRAGRAQAAEEWSTEKLALEQRKQYLQQQSDGDAGARLRESEQERDTAQSKLASQTEADKKRAEAENTQKEVKKIVDRLNAAN